VKNNYGIPQGPMMQLLKKKKIKELKTNIKKMVLVFFNFFFLKKKEKKKIKEMKKMVFVVAWTCRNRNFPISY